MKNLKKIAAIILSAALVVALAACGSSKDSDSNKSSGKAETLTMGTNASFPPYEYVDDNGKIVGIDAEIAQAIAYKLGMKL